MEIYMWMIMIHNINNYINNILLLSNKLMIKLIKYVMEKNIIMN